MIDVPAHTPAPLLRRTRVWVLELQNSSEEGRCLVSGDDLKLRSNVMAEPNFQKLHMMAPCDPNHSHELCFLDRNAEIEE